MLHENQVSFVSVQPIREYLERIRAQQDITWLNKMRYLLDLYKGDCLGFDDSVESSREARKTLKNFLREGLLSFLKNVLPTMQSSREDRDESDSINEKDRNVYKSVVEFCLIMDKDMDLLFKEAAG